jgi:hypothetical protein
MTGSGSCGLGLSDSEIPEPVRGVVRGELRSEMQWISDVVLVLFVFSCHVHLRSDVTTPVGL